MKNIKLIYSLTLLMVLGSCTDFEDYQSDPNRTTEGDPGLILTGIEVAAFNEVTLDGAMATRNLVDIESMRAVQYYGWQRSGFGAYNNLRQVQKMVEEAELVGKTNYLAIGKYFKAYFILKLTNTFGDVPYSEAMTGESDNPNFIPAYDSQENIYLGILNDLEDANAMLDVANGSISGDIIYDGDIEKWKKAINSLSLRVLISLSRKEGNSAIGVINRFKAIISDPAKYPIFSTNFDNTQLDFHNIEGNEYPYFNSNWVKTNVYFEESFVNHLKSRLDPRLFIFAQKEENGKDLDDFDFNAYGGLGGSDLATINSQRVTSGEGSQIAERYYNDAINEPSIAIGHAEIQFTIAEAAARGWITADAELFYNSGIKASMRFYGIDESIIEAYLLNPNVKYNAQNAIEMIITQKYLSFFMNSGWEGFYNQRRTGFPEFSTDGDGILNDGVIPKRWMYPEDEIFNNKESLEAAIKNQYPEGDNVNGEMWLLKNE